MKRIFALATLCSALMAFQVKADNPSTVCSNGTIETVGDALFMVEILEDGIQFSPYEAGFTVDAGDTTYENGNISIFNKKVDFSVEGEESTKMINALLLFSDSDKKLNLALSYDNEPFETYELTCVVKEN